MTRHALPILALAALCSAQADATMINTIIGNFDVAFDGATGSLTDFNSPAGGNLDENEAREFSSIEIEVGGDTSSMLMNPPDELYGDLLIGNLGPELTIGSLESNQGGPGNLFDFFTPSGDLLRLAVDPISYTLVTTPIPTLNIFTFFATATVIDQSLPGGEQYFDDVLISYTATDVMVMTGSTGADMIIASGAMTITGAGIPEPTSGLLAIAAAVVGAACRRRG